MLLDKNGLEIRKGQDVLAYNEDTGIEFSAYVHGFNKGELVIVCDQEDNYFRLEPENIEVLD